MLKKLLLIDAPEDGAAIAAACATADLETVFLPGAEAPTADAIAAAAREHRAHGVWSCTGRAWEACLTAAARLGMPRLDIALRTDLAIVVQHALAADHVPHAPVRLEDDAQGAADIAAEWGTPLWVRPAGGIGVSTCATVEHLPDLPLAFNQALKKSPGNRVLLQRAVEGDVFRIVGYKVHRAFYPAEVIRELTAGGAFRYPTGSVVPSGLSGYQFTAVMDIAKKAGLAVPPCCGLLEIEVVLTADGPVFTGVWALPEVDKLRAALLRQSGGIDLEVEALRVAAGGLPRVSTQKELGVAIAWLDAHSGVVTEISGIEAARELPGICEVVLNIQPGETLGHVTDVPSRDRTGYVIACRATAKEALETAQQAVRQIHIATRPMMT